MLYQRDRSCLTPAARVSLVKYLALLMLAGAQNCAAIIQHECLAARRLASMLGGALVHQLIMITETAIVPSPYYSINSGYLEK